MFAAAQRAKATAREPHIARVQYVTRSESDAARDQVLYRYENAWRWRLCMQAVQALLIIGGGAQKALMKRISLARWQVLQADNNTA